MSRIELDMTQYTVAEYNKTEHSSIELFLNRTISNIVLLQGPSLLLQALHKLIPTVHHYTIGHDKTEKGIIIQ